MVLKEAGCEGAYFGEGQAEVATGGLVFTEADAEERWGEEPCFFWGGCFGEEDEAFIWLLLLL